MLRVDNCMLVAKAYHKYTVLKHSQLQQACAMCSAATRMLVLDVAFCKFNVLIDMHLSELPKSRAQD